MDGNFALKRATELLEELGKLQDKCNPWGLQEKHPEIYRALCHVETGLQAAERQLEGLYQMGYHQMGHTCEDTEGVCKACEIMPCY